MSVVWMMAQQPQLPFPTRVAMKCAGEGRFAMSACSCTVKNRMLRGWSEARVLSQYYAPYLKVSASEVATVTAVLSGKTYCDPAWYFLYSKEDVAALRIKQAPIYRINNGRESTLVYEYWYSRRAK